MKATRIKEGGTEGVGMDERRSIATAITKLLLRVLRELRAFVVNP
jgi:hypothetical protein